MPDLSCTLSWSARLLQAATQPLDLTPEQLAALNAEVTEGRVTPAGLDAWFFRRRLCLYAVGTAPSSCENCGRELELGRRADARTCNRACYARARRATLAGVLPEHAARVEVYADALRALDRELELLLAARDPGYTPNHPPLETA